MLNKKWINKTSNTNQINLFSMNIIAVIPARYSSSRFPGKPLADINGKPMIWWVYNQVTKIKQFSNVIIATDDERIADVCKQHKLQYMMTSSNHPTHVHRIYEISEHIPADYYAVICGDEPLISTDTINAILPENNPKDEIYVGGLCRYFSDPVEVIDPANIKIVTNEKDECILLSRAVVPFPYKTICFKYKKVIGVECYNKKALDFFISTPKGYLESIEDVTLQRFLEHKIHIKYKLVDSTSLSVDTPSDLEKVRNILKEK